MPRRTDLPSILIIGGGPIIVGQAAEFAHSGTQAAKTRGLGASPGSGKFVTSPS